ncbi:hypothetical protein O0L34_g7750 [Tuta absoluta]|nr:hypothetical protein O0L34_g7750 [Tuta absoluta]
MLPEPDVETKIPNGTEAHANEDSAFVKTVRLTLNLTTHILIVLIVFVCLLYAWTGPKLNDFQLHIVLCVLGYQFFMSQGTLVASKYNCWSMFLPRRYRRHLHWFLQVIGVTLVTAGSCVMIKAKSDNFNTCHGVLGLCALMTALLGFINGLLVINACNWRSYLNVYWLKFIHYAAGVGTMLLSAASLCLGFGQDAFTNWSGREDAAALVVFTIMFTFLVAVEFWLLICRKIRH